MRDAKKGLILKLIQHPELQKRRDLGILGRGRHKLRKCWRRNYKVNESLDILIKSLWDTTDWLEAVLRRRMVVSA